MDSPVLHPANGRDIDLTNIKMLSHDEGWAVGNVGTHVSPSNYVEPEYGVILHYQRGTWSIAAQTSIVMQKISMFSPTEGWAAGNLWEGSHLNMLHYSNGTWTYVNRPQDARYNNGVTNIALTSATDGWGISTNCIYRFQHGTWSTQYTRGENEWG